VRDAPGAPPRVPAAVAATAQAGAASVFGCLARTAEAVPEGVRWRTLSYRNAPHYDPNLYDGMAPVRGLTRRGPGAPVGVRGEDTPAVARPRASDVTRHRGRCSLTLTTRRT
jgi:hypothetical protein